ncbi:Scm4p NDAI_0D04100 [Naumovozyma dairenensis CBS 421]|uniref:Autophagy-related protein 33 n=1 Tax=Naumovozyma dairenensis (strain ATCC 10597 / BCRC 20456 / CBS 421 / NBRC 0211 / NRRL Y-12639) TaxID=1071378 RepID=G0WAB3_NAUDC|nr:hypothetical protein NDAI_0D04100 [Naumovozyma dairenensis CBS 421]CCD24724.1 hypothetical protein NDAI_0D04100 [Naumovozyma dairenensis CBS 421]
MPHTSLDLTKTVAISSLGLYAGLLTTTTLVSTITPIDLLTSQVRHLACVIGCYESGLAALSTGAFALTYYLSPPKLRLPYLLYGVAVSPLTCGYMYVSSKLSHAWASKKEIKSNAENSDMSSPEVVEEPTSKVPFHHPPIDGSAEGAECPFGKKAHKNGASVKPNASCHKALNIQLWVSAAAALGIFVKIVHESRYEPTVLL